LADKEGGRWDDKAEGLNGSLALTLRPFSPHVKPFIRQALDAISGPCSTHCALPGHIHTGDKGEGAIFSSRITDPFRGNY
jgi:hypothetical protein